MNQLRDHPLICSMLKSSINVNSMLHNHQPLVSLTVINIRYLHFHKYHIGLDFSGFIEAFFLLAQRKYSTAETIFDSVTELVDTCMARLNPSINESD